MMDIKRFEEKLEYAKNLLDNVSNGDQARNAILGAANVLNGYDIEEQIRVLSSYAQRSNDDQEIIRLCERLTDELTETIAALKEPDPIPSKKWWEFWKS